MLEARAVAIYGMVTIGLLIVVLLAVLFGQS